MQGILIRLSGWPASWPLYQAKCIQNSLFLVVVYLQYHMVLIGPCVLVWFDGITQSHWDCSSIKGVDWLEDMIQTPSQKNGCVWQDKTNHSPYGVSVVCRIQIWPPFVAVLQVKQSFNTWHILSHALTLFWNLKFTYVVHIWILPKATTTPIKCPYLDISNIVFCILADSLSASLYMFPCLYTCLTNLDGY